VVSPAKSRPEDDESCSPGAGHPPARALAAFSATLRNEVELDKLSAALLRVVEETVQPAQASLWLRKVVERKVQTY
jgi:hypothetical protein